MKLEKRWGVGYTVNNFPVESKKIIFKKVIPLPPVTKKNSQRILINHSTGKRFIAPSKRFMDYQNNCGYFLKIPVEPIEERVNIMALYYMGTKRKVDISNLHSALHDVLVHYKIIKDDDSTIVVGTDRSRVLYDKDNPRTEIYIQKMEGVEK